VKKYLGFALVFLLAGCSGKVAEMMSSAPPSAVYVLIDISASTDSDRVRSQVRKDFDTILAAWKTKGGVLRGDVIGGNSLNESTVPIRVTIPAFNVLTSEEQYHEKKVVGPALEQAHKQLEQALLTKASQKSAILDAIGVAAKVLNGEELRQSGHRALVVFSDMVEESDLYNFQSDSLSDSRIEAILKAERESGRIPNLNGVRVWKAGAASGDLKEAKSRQLEKFWLQYFQAAGADVAKERYAPILLDFGLSW